MTKKVRIENADTSNYGLWVIVEERQVNSETWVEVDRKPVFYPTELLEIYVHSNRRLVIEERMIATP